MTKMLTKKLVTEDIVLDKQPRHAILQHIHQSIAQAQIIVQRNIKIATKVAVTITLCTAINPASSLRELRLYSLGRRRALPALTPLGEYRYESYRCLSCSSWEGAGVLG